jgi:hypothetical protein
VVCGGHRVVVGGAYGEKLNEESREPGGQSIFERFFMLFSFLEVNPLESINCRVLCHHFTTLLKIQKILVKSGAV